MTKRVSAATLRGMLDDGGELALIDVREEGAFAASHLLHAISVPLSRLELEIGELVPRRGARIVLCDAGESEPGEDGLAERAAARLAEFGYTDVSILEGGTKGWATGGGELFSGFNVPSKAFGEFVEHVYGTPSISAEELKAMMDSGTDLVVLDSRPIDEYRVMNIPTGICCPGGELVYRLPEIAPDPNTTVVVNCAGRTRSIIGAQSLINAGVPNRVVALRNGTMGWHLAGYGLERGNERRAPDPKGEAAKRAGELAAQVRERFGVRTIVRETLEHWRSEADRHTLFVFDVRHPEEYEAGHLPGSISAPGGQLVQATDRYAGTRGARIVLVDDTGVRATMTAHWLLHMNWDVYVLEGGLPADATEKGKRRRTALGLDKAKAEMVSPSRLREMLDRGEATVLDLGSSRRFRDEHIPGAWWGVRSRLKKALGAIPQEGTLVLTSGDGLVARLAAREAQGLTDRPVKVLDGGTDAWHAAGFPLNPGKEDMTDVPDDVWLKPYDRDDGKVEDAMREYLSWEIDLVHQIERDGTARFRSFA